MAFIEKENKNLSLFRFRRTFTASARAAFRFILESRKGVDRRGILLPSYIGLSKIEGSGVFDPIRASGMDYSFYRVDKGLQPDLIELEGQLRGGNFQLVFLIHYFGFPQVDVEQFVALCRRYDVRVIEDCAHTLLGGLDGPRLGSHGDYAIFSIHKSEATVDGGFFLDHTGELDLDSLSDEFRISQKTLTEFADTDIHAVSIQRLRNYGVVANWVRSMASLELMFKSPPKGAVPLNCPVIVRGGQREQMYFSLIKRGILPTALYHTLIPEITCEDYPDSHFVAANILNLPTHADISEADLIHYERALKEAYIEGFST